MTKAVDHPEREKQIMKRNDPFPAASVSTRVYGVDSE